MEASAGVVTKACLAAALAAVSAAEEELGRLDAAAGDGDHGTGMVRGFRAAVAATEDMGGPARDILMTAGGAFSDAAGGASGALIGVWLTAMGQALPADDAIDGAVVGRTLEAGRVMVQRLGKAQPGDKTLLDTLAPFVQAYGAAVAGGLPLVEAWLSALPAAEAGMRATTDLVSRRGRAARLGERSRGHQDAGATSLFYVLLAAGDTLEEMAGGEPAHT